MPVRKFFVPGLTTVAIMPMLLAACAGPGESPDANERQSCTDGQVLFCTGGTVSKTGGVRDREPRICECRDPSPQEM